MTAQTKQLSFVADEETIALIEDLKEQLEARTSAAVFRKALALTKVAVEQAKGSNGVVTVRGRSQSPADEISIALKA